MLPTFALSYKVAGAYYSGRFSLSPYISDPPDEVINRIIGRKLVLRYAPKHPDVWFIPKDLIEGCKIEQKLRPGLFLSLYPRS